MSKRYLWNTLCLPVPSLPIEPQSCQVDNLSKAEQRKDSRLSGFHFFYCGMNDDNEEPLKKRSKVVQNPLEQPSHDVAISASDEARTADAAIPVMSPELSTMDFSQRVVWGKYDLNHPLPLVPLDAEPVFSDASPALCHYVHAVSGRARACTMHLRAQPGQQVPTTTNTTTPCEDSYSLETRPVPTPIFMPVGTKGCLKALAFHEWMQDPALQCPIILANTYHLAIQPGTELIDEMGGLHAFQGLPNLEKNNASNTDANETDSVLPYNLLTDSGGFQMVSLVSLSQVSEEGVSFENPYNSTRKSKAANSSSAGKNSERWNDLQSPEPNEANPTSSDGDLLLLRPEDSIRHQHRIRANIIMALDDVVSSVQLDEQRMITATHRTLRWYDRCYKVHHEAQPQQYHLDDGSNNENKESFRIPAHTQNLFPIVQGGLDIALGGLREQCLAGFRHREVNQQYITPGYAIGGLAGGENKDDFWRVIDLCCRALPDSKPRYLMG